MNKIIVEGKNDRAFVNAVKNYLKQQGTNIDFEISTLRSGLSEVNIQRELEDLRDDLFKIPSSTIKLGLILDVDNPDSSDYSDRKEMVLNSLKIVFSHLEEVSFDELPISFIDKNRTINVSYFLNKDSTGNGELMNVLREIKKQDASIANCIETCCKTKGDYHQKNFDDDWSHFYMKWDCNNLEARTNSKNFTLEKISQEQMESFWNFEHNFLNPLKQYLTQFQ